MEKVPGPIRWRCVPSSRHKPYFGAVQSRRKARQESLVSLITPWKSDWIVCQGDDNDDGVGGSDGRVDVSLVHVGAPCSPGPVLNRVRFDS